MDETSIGKDGTANLGAALLSLSATAAAFFFFAFSKPIFTAMMMKTIVLAKAMTTAFGAF